MVSEIDALLLLLLLGGLNLLTVGAWGAIGLEGKTLIAPLFLDLSRKGFGFLGVVPDAPDAADAFEFKLSTGDKEVNFGTDPLSKLF